MDNRFLLHNIHRDDSKNFRELDPHLRQLKQLKYLQPAVLLNQFPVNIPGIYTLTGGNLTGKTTLLKQWIAKLLVEGIPAQAITFFSGELIHDDEDLIHLLQTQLKYKSAIQYVLIDDITHLRGWDKAIKIAADTGILDHAIVLLTSSDKTISSIIATHFPGRESESKDIHFRLYPLTFHECVSLKHPNVPITKIDLFKEFNDYLVHGGYLVAMNDMAMQGQISDETLKLYSHSLCKEMLHHGKQEAFFREIVIAIIEHYDRPITWNELSQEVAINHPKTIGNYLTLLESLDAAYVQYALLEESLTGAPKKARKLMFTDPFIYHAMRAWARFPQKNAFNTEIKPSIENAELCSRLVKACVTLHYRRYYPTYYIKAEGEIDLAYLQGQRFWPIVITWTNQLRSKDLKQILKYPNSKILTKTLRSGIIDHIRTEPLPQALWRLDDWHRINNEV